MENGLHPVPNTPRREPPAGSAPRTPDTAVPVVRPHAATSLGGPVGRPAVITRRRLLNFSSSLSACRCRSSTPISPASRRWRSSASLYSIPSRLALAAIAPIRPSILSSCRCAFRSVNRCCCCSWCRARNGYPSAIHRSVHQADHAERERRGPVSPPPRRRMRRLPRSTIGSNAW